MALPHKPDSLPSAGSAFPVLPALLSPFTYTAQTDDGIRITGVMEAPDGATAFQFLESMRLRVIEVAAHPTPARRTQHADRDDGFVHFNQRLAQLLHAGLPIETGLRMAAIGMRRGRLSRAVLRIADDLKAGLPLVDAFGKRRRAFPLFYVRLLDLGSRHGELPAMLTALGPQLDGDRRLRAALWRRTATPLMTLVGVLVVLAFVGTQVFPALNATLKDMRLQPNAMTNAATALGQIAPYLAGGAVGIVVLGAMAWALVWAAAGQARLADRYLPRVPFIGPVLHFSLISRWLTAMRMGVWLGLELPAAVELAGDVTASLALRNDGSRWISALATGRPLASAKGRLLPAFVPAAIEFALANNDLPRTLQTLSDLYDRQTQLRLERITSLLTPWLIILIVLLVGFMGGGMLMPLFLMLRDFGRSVW